MSVRVDVVLEAFEHDHMLHVALALLLHPVNERRLVVSRVDQHLWPQLVHEVARLEIDRNLLSYVDPNKNSLEDLRRGWRWRQGFLGLWGLVITGESPSAIQNAVECFLLRLNRLDLTKSSMYSSRSLGSSELYVRKMNPGQMRSTLNKKKSVPVATSCEYFDVSERMVFQLFALEEMPPAPSVLQQNEHQVSPVSPRPKQLVLLDLLGFKK